MGEGEQVKFLVNGRNASCMKRRADGDQCHVFQHDHQQTLDWGLGGFRLSWKLLPGTRRTHIGTKHVLEI